MDQEAIDRRVEELKESRVARQKDRDVYRNLDKGHAKRIRNEKVNSKKCIRELKRLKGINSTLKILGELGAVFVIVVSVTEVAQAAQAEGGFGPNTRGVIGSEFANYAFPAAGTAIGVLIGAPAGPVGSGIVGTIGGLVGGLIGDLVTDTGPRGTPQPLSHSIPR
jgi:hypothetical protein